MYKEMFYALDDVLEMKFCCTEKEKRLIIRDVLKSKRAIKDPTIYTYETLFFDGIFVVIDRDECRDVQKCIYYAFHTPKKRSLKVASRAAEEESLVVST
jgi:hypothetical protein